MSLHADGHAKPFGERHAGLEHPRSRPELLLTGRLFRGQRTAEDAHQRGFPIAGQLEEPGQLGTRIVVGEADRAVHRDDGQAGCGHGPLDLGSVSGGHRRVDELTIDKPELDAGITPAAAE